jgi:tetratricopeptide (TPR) repeat protein
MEAEEVVADPAHGAAPNYSAFISYSHADSAVVRKLHARLEAYRLPRRVRQIDPLNAQRERLGRVFRDREDLSAAQSLSDAITDALVRSQVLVVVCSPAAKASRWVEQEIAFFREHCPGRPILAAIIRGKPGEAFPAGLSEDGIEPLAADLRKDGDGWRLGFLKIVAGIANVPLDALIQRDSQRQLRRVMAVTGVTALVAIAMGAMTTVAIQARNEARAQQAQAEGLIEYMITDLREDLEGVGRIDIMGGVNTRALKYYQNQQNLDSFEGNSLLRRGRVIEALGRDEEKRGNMGKARAHYRELYRTTQELLAREPDNPERILAHAWSENRIATIAEPNTDPAKMQAQFSHVLKMLDSIAEWGRDNPDWWKTYALSSGNKCAMGVLANDTSDEIREFCRTAIDAGKRFAKIGQQAEALFDMAYNLYWLSKLEELRGNRAAAFRAGSEALAISDRLIAPDPQNAKYLRQRIEVLGRLIANNDADTRERLIEAVAIADRLIERDPEDADLKSIRANYSRKLGSIVK